MNKSKNEKIKRAIATLTLIIFLMLINVLIRTVTINILADSAMPGSGDQHSINKLNDLKENSVDIRNVLLFSMFINVLIYIPMRKLNNLKDDNLKFTIGTLTFVLLLLLLVSLISNGSVSNLADSSMPRPVPEYQFTIDRINDLKNQSRHLKISLVVSILANTILYKTSRKIEN